MAGILGDAEIIGNAGTVNAAASYLRSRARLGDTIEGRLSGGGAKPGSWNGGGSDAYKSALGDLPHELNQLTRSYHRAADALKTYAHELHTHKLFAHKMAIRLAEEQHNHDDAVTAAGQAKTAYDGAKAAHDLPHVDPQSKSEFAKDMTRHGAALSAAQSKAADSEAAIAHIRKAAHANKVDFLAAAKACAAHIDDASELSIKVKHYSDLEKFAHTLEHLASGALNAFGDLIDKLADVADIAVIFALIATVGTGILTVLTDGAAAPLFIASLDALETAGLAKAGADIAAVAAGKRDPTVLIEDALSVVGGGATTKLTKRAYGDFQKALEAGTHATNPGQAAYAKHLLKVFLGHAAAKSGGSAAELEPKLRDKLVELLKESGCSSHSGSVPAHR